MIKRPRGSVKKESAVPVTLWVPRSWLAPIDQAVREEDSDKSKFVRNAIKEKLARIGVAVCA